jgi:hypothetical protein
LVSHDLWHSDDPAAFVEMRLLWHALRHMGVQPDFLREEDVERGRLAPYRVLYVTGQTPDTWRECRNRRMGPGGWCRLSVRWRGNPR